MALLVERGCILKRLEHPTPRSRRPEETLGCVLRMIEALRGENSLGGVGLAIPGMLDLSREACLKLPNLPGWEGFRPAEFISSRLGLPVWIENDANCYALGEGAYGAAKGFRNFIVFTWGTGIGAGIVCNGALFLGSHGLGGELGHLVVDGARPCGCGGIGHAETIAGADALEARAREHGLVLDVKGLWERRDNPSIAPLWKDMFDGMGRTLASAVHAFDPEVVVMGGGISQAPGILEPLRAAVLRYLAIPYRKSLDLRLSLLGNDASALGAASLAGGKTP